MDKDTQGSVTRPPIDGVLDLHAFRPREVPDVVREYLRECHRLGITQVRIVHGKGKGVQREIVHAILRSHPHAVSFRLAGDSGGWGATLVDLAGGQVPHPPPSGPTNSPPLPIWQRLLRIFGRSRPP